MAVIYGPAAQTWRDWRTGAPMTFEAAANLGELEIGETLRPDPDPDPNPR